MAIQHVTRRGDTYYLHEGRTRTGKPHFFFSRKQEGTLAQTVPDGYEVYETPNGQVYLRKAVPRVVTDEEVATVEQAVRELAELDYFLIEVKGPSIIVLTPNQDVADLEEMATPLLRRDPTELRRRIKRLLSYSPVMQFTLVDEEGRKFSVDRWCSLGSIDDWFPLSPGKALQDQVAKYCPHLGRQSFYDLM